MEFKHGSTARAPGIRERRYARSRTGALNAAHILIVGGGIGGLTSAIALRARGFTVDVVERDPNWSVYGVGIIQQANVIRAMSQLGLLGDYLEAGFGFDQVDIYAPNGQKLASVPSPKPSNDYPANVGIGRRALHKILGDRANGAGAQIRLGVTVTQFDERPGSLHARFSDGSEGDYDLAIGADGVYSDTRRAILPDAPQPEFTGQGVWRYNFARPDSVTCLHAYEGRTGIGLVPLSHDLMYMYVTTPEPGNPHYPREGLAASMRSKLASAPSTLAPYVDEITDDAAVVYKPLEWLLLTGDWHCGRVVLLGDAVHATTPHLGQGAGMAIEDSLVLAEELARAPSPEAAFKAYRARRFERCKFVVERSKAICDAQLGKGPAVNQAEETARMSATLSAPF